MSDEHAVFVSPAGNDGATGAQGDPLKSITEATNVANAEGKIVVVCNGTYDEHVKITTGAKVYGGFDCSTWAHQTGTRADVVPTTTGYALEIDSVTDPVVIEDIGFKAADGVAPGESSIAGFVKTSPIVMLRRVSLRAGKGADGADGSSPAFTFPTTTQLVGDGAEGAVAGLTLPFACPAGDMTTGGPGGSGGGASGTSGGDGLPALGAGNGGSNALVCGSGGTGTGGNPGANGQDMPGATTLGTLSTMGWTPADGQDGEHGNVGQGGGGGRGDATFGGGGGGNGGCGGSGAKAGRGGGASIGLMTIESPVIAEHSEIVAADAGNGGAGKVGQLGMTKGGSGGLPGGAGDACQGGAGGAGGNGGASGGGAGGVSVGVLYAGAQPSLSATSPVVGQAGKGGLGGKPGINDGIAGQAVPELQID